MSKPAFEVIDIKGEPPPKHKPASRPVKPAPDAPRARIGHGLNGVNDEHALAQYHATVRAELNAYDAECDRVAKQAVGINAYARPAPAALQDKPLSNDGWARNSVPEFICSYSTSGVLLHQIRNPNYIRPRSRLEFLEEQAKKLRDQLVIYHDHGTEPAELKAKYDAVNAEIAAIDAVDPARIEARRRRAEVEAWEAENRRQTDLEAARAKAEATKREYERAIAEIAALEGRKENR